MRTLIIGAALLIGGGCAAAHAAEPAGPCNTIAQAAQLGVRARNDGIALDTVAIAIAEMAQSNPAIVAQTREMPNLKAAMEKAGQRAWEHGGTEAAAYYDTLAACKRGVQ